MANHPWRFSKFEDETMKRAMKKREDHAYSPPWERRLGIQSSMCPPSAEHNHHETEMTLRREVTDLRHRLGRCEVYAEELQRQLAAAEVRDAVETCQGG